MAAAIVEHAETFRRKQKQGKPYPLSPYEGSWAYWQEKLREVRQEVGHRLEKCRCQHHAMPHIFPVVDCKAVNEFLDRCGYPEHLSREDLEAFETELEESSVRSWRQAYWEKKGAPC